VGTPDEEEMTSKIAHDADALILMAASAFWLLGD
jgi:hypothetical protein